MITYHIGVDFRRRSKALLFLCSYHRKNHSLFHLFRKWHIFVLFRLHKRNRLCRISGLQNILIFCREVLALAAYRHQNINQRNLQQFLLIQFLIYSLHDNKPVYRLLRQSIRRLAFVPPYSVFCSISFRCGGLSIERNQKPLAPEITLAVTHHDRQKQVEVKRSSRVNPHEIRIFSGCPYAVVKQGTKKFTKK